MKEPWHNTEIIHFNHCEIKIIRIFVILFLLKQHCWPSKAGIYSLDGYLPLSYRGKGFRLVWAKVHSTLSPLWYCIFNDKGYWKSSVSSRHASSAYTIKKRGKRKNPVFSDVVLLLSGRCHINSCNSLIRKELQNRVWISGKKINGNPRLK